MNFALAGVILLTLLGIKADFTGGGLDACLNRRQTTAVNGVFVALVFLSHFKGYIECGPYDKVYWVFSGLMGQCVVTTFLFYSGYGILVSMKNKPNYWRTFPKRILKLWLQFAVAVCIFLVLNLVMGREYSAIQILLSFTAWDSVGNSNWYVFAILVLYLLSYWGGLLTKGDRLKTILFVTVGCCCYVIVLGLCGKGSYWYDTIFCYPLGMLCGEYEWKLKQLIQDTKRFLILLGGCGVAFVAAFLLLRSCSGVIALAAVELRNLLFVCGVVLVTSRIHIGNPVLNWLGQHTFEIYILQRLPMIAFRGVDMNQYVYLLVCIIITAFLAAVYQIVIMKMMKKCHLP